MCCLEDLVYCVVLLFFWWLGLLLCSCFMYVLYDFVCCCLLYGN